MRARAIAEPHLTTRIAVGAHGLIADEPIAVGGRDRGPSPRELIVAALASCTAITVQEFARRRGWDLGPVAVSVDCAKGPADDAFGVLLELPDGIDPDRVSRLLGAARSCPVRRGLEAAPLFSERVVLADGA